MKQRYIKYLTSTFYLLLLSKGVGHIHCSFTKLTLQSAEKYDVCRCVLPHLRSFLSLSKFLSADSIAPSLSAALETHDFMSVSPPIRALYSASLHISCCCCCCCCCCFAVYYNLWKMKMHMTAESRTLHARILFTFLTFLGIPGRVSSKI